MRPLLPHYRGPLPNEGAGAFGAVAPYRCLDCKRPIWCEPWADEITRATALDPAEYAYRCPHCGRHEVSEVEQGPRVCRVTNRTTISRPVEARAKDLRQSCRCKRA